MGSLTPGPQFLKAMHRYSGKIPGDEGSTVIAYLDGDKHGEKVSAVVELVRTHSQPIKKKNPMDPNKREVDSRLV